MFMQDTWPAVHLTEWKTVHGARSLAGVCTQIYIYIYTHTLRLVRGPWLHSGGWQTPGPDSSRCLRTGNRSGSSRLTSSQHPHSCGALRTTSGKVSQRHGANQDVLHGHRRSGIGAARFEPSTGRTTCSKCTFTPVGRAPTACRAEDTLA